MPIHYFMICLSIHLNHVETVYIYVDLSTQQNKQIVRFPHNRKDNMFISNGSGLEKQRFFHRQMLVRWNYSELTLSPIFRKFRCRKSAFSGFVSSICMLWAHIRQYMMGDTSTMLCNSTISLRSYQHQPIALVCSHHKATLDDKIACNISYQTTKILEIAAGRTLTSIYSYKKLL